MLGLFQFAILILRGAFQQNLVGLKMIALHGSNHHNLLRAVEILRFGAVVHALLHQILVVDEGELEMVRVELGLVEKAFCFTGGILL